MVVQSDGPVEGETAKSAGFASHVSRAARAREGAQSAKNAGWRGNGVGPVWRARDTSAGMRTTEPIYVAGARSFPGCAILGRLREQGFDRSFGEDEPDLSDAALVEDYFRERGPSIVLHAGGASAGIGGNARRPAALLLDNLRATANVLDAARRHGVRRLLYLASSCCYPRIAPQPLAPEHLWTGPLEPTNEAYAAGKLAGISLCQAMRRQYGVSFIVGIPANVFGPGDCFDLENAHVAAALLRRFHEAKQARARAVTLWGTGAPRREFLYARDLADACLHVIGCYDGEAPINLAGGEELSIAQLAEQVAEVVGFEGRIEFDRSRPDGTPRKVLDPAAIRALGWRPRTALPAALKETYADFVNRWGAARSHGRTNL